jgi:hypothetical protein
LEGPLSQRRVISRPAKTRVLTISAHDNRLAMSAERPVPEAVSMKRLGPQASLRSCGWSHQSNFAAAELTIFTPDVSAGSPLSKPPAPQNNPAGS